MSDGEVALQRDEDEIVCGREGSGPHSPGGEPQVAVDAAKDPNIRNAPQTEATHFSEKADPTCSQIDCGLVDYCNVNRLLPIWKVKGTKLNIDNVGQNLYYVLP